MKNYFLILVSFIFLTGCAQNFAFLGPAYSIAKTGGIQHALISESINYGVKNKTGKNVGEHMLSSIMQDDKPQNQ